MYKNPTPIKYGLNMQKEEKLKLLAQMKPPLPYFLSLYPHNTADRYAHLQLNFFTHPAGHTLKPCFLSIHFNITLSFMLRSNLWLSIQVSDTEITARQYNDCNI